MSIAAGSSVRRLNKFSCSMDIAKWPWHEPDLALAECSQPLLEQGGCSKSAFGPAPALYGPLDASARNRHLHKRLGAPHSVIGITRGLNYHSFTTLFGDPPPPRGRGRRERGTTVQYQLLDLTLVGVKVCSCLLCTYVLCF